MTTWYSPMASSMPAGLDGGLDLDPVTDDYACAAPGPGGLSRVVLQPRDGTLRVRAFGHGGGQDLGEVTADAVFAVSPQSRAGHAFLATFDDGGVRRHLQTYQGLGVLVVHSFHRFEDPRKDYFCREFFVTADRKPEERGPTPLTPAVAESDPAAWYGTWTNPNAAATGLTEVEFRRSGTDTVMRAKPAGDGKDWDEVRMHPYSDAAAPDNPPALLATYDHGFMRVHLQARINRGLLVMGEYAEIADDSGRSHFMQRECFYR